MKLLLYFYLIASVSSCVVFHPRNYKFDKWKFDKIRTVSVDTVSADSIAADYWALCTELLPEEMVDKYVDSIVLFSDGPLDEVGATSLGDTTLSSWIFWIDTFDFDSRTTDSAFIVYYTHTIIHEFGHILTQNETQMDVYSMDTYADYRWDTTIYAVYFTSHISTPKPNSYLYKFVKDYWEGDHLDYWNSINYTINSRKRERMLYSYYDYYAHRHVTEYSATSPDEDIAESWTFFVLCDKPTKKGIKYDKIRFFYEFPELIEMRENIRSKLKYIPKNYLETYELQMYDYPYLIEKDTRRKLKEKYG